MLRRFFAVIGKELSLAAASPSAWVFLVIFLVLSSFCAFVASGMFASGQADLTPFFDWMPWLFLLIVPALAMPMWSEERRLGVFELTLSFPASSCEMAVGKFLAGSFLLLLALLLTFPVPVTAIVLGEPDIGAILCGYAGALLLGCAYLSMASFCSAVSKSQTASFLLSVLLCGFFLFAGWQRVTDLLGLWLPHEIVQGISSCSFLSNYQAFQKGVADTSELIYSVSLSGFFLALTWFTLELVAAVPGGLFAPGILKNGASRRAAGKFLLRLCWIFVVSVSLTTIGRVWKYRIDVSSDQAYSIAPASKAIAGKLEQPVLLRFYASRSSKVMMPVLRKYADRVEWLLQEFAAASNGKIVLQIVDPAADPIYDEAASLDGCTAISDASGEQIYLGISASYGARTQVIPFLSPKQEAHLEHEIIRIVQNVSKKNRPKLGIMSPLPVFGKRPDFGNFQQRSMETVTIDPPWYVISELMKDYDVVQVPMDAPEIPAELNALIVIHPSGILPRTVFALDQFVLRGGNLAVFVDPRSFYAVLKAKTDYSMLERFTSGLSPLLQSWGVDYSQEQMVADMVSAYRRKLPDRNVTNPMVMNLQQARFDKESPETAYLNLVSMYFGGCFSVEERPGVESRVLISSSPESQVISSMLADRNELVLRRFKAGGQELPLAVRLEGTFKTAFPAGAPDKTLFRPGTVFLKESGKKSRIYLFADADMLFNDVCLTQVPDVTGQKMWLTANDNVNLLLNIAEQLTGEPTLATIRSRIPMSRPLSRFNEIKANAELRYRNRILQAERNYLLAGRRLEQLNRMKKSRPSKALFEEIRKETQKFNEARRELNLLRHSLQSELEEMETRIKVINLVVLPGIIALLGILYAVFRHSRMTRRKRS